MKLINYLPAQWIEFLELNPDFFSKIESALQGQELNPELSNIFRAFNISPFEVRLVIIGQDPYPDPAAAMGLAFSVPHSLRRLPASLKNIKKELESDLGVQLSDTGDLSAWANQGVLLLNRVLTTKPGLSNAHQGIGWEEFTDLVVGKLAKSKVIFLLWGKQAHNLERYIPSEFVVKGVHPSPLSAYRGFFGSRPFSEINRKLVQIGRAPIKWSI